MNSQKTVICKFYPKCSRGDKCTFAHGQSELFKARPCWFFNNGGCNFTDEDCPRRHELVSDIRKPLALQRPCNSFHTNKCHFGTRCRFDHFELTEQEWTSHYPTIPYPGVGYTTFNPDKPRPRQPPPPPPEPRQPHFFPIFRDSDFPPLPSSAPVVDLEESVVQTPHRDIIVDLEGYVVQTPDRDINVDLEGWVVKALKRDGWGCITELVPLYYKTVDETLKKKSTLDPSDLVGGVLTKDVVSTLYKYDFDAHVAYNIISA